MDKILTYLYNLERRGIKVGLDHTKNLLKKIGNPQKKFSSIHVAGTNGKGSTCVMIASILRTYGLKIGLYTSPHLIRFNERIRVNGVPISDYEIKKFVKKYKIFFDEIPVTFFEATTAMAFWYFNKLSVDVAVVEVGLGGRLDSTNVLNPSLSVITSIGIDHRHILGDSLENIAREKGGIIKNNIPVVVGPQIKKINDIFENICKKNNSSCHFTKIPKSYETNWVEMKSLFWINDVSYTIPMVGAHQSVNAAIAIQSVKIYNRVISSKIIQKGLNKTIWPGRLQKLSNNYPIFYDVAHNGHGLKAIMSFMEQNFSEKPIGIIGLKGDKELDLIVTQIKGKFSQLITVGIKNDELYTSKKLSNKIKKYNIISTAEDNIQLALLKIEHKFNSKTPILFFGSHYIAKDVFDAFEFSFDSGII